MAAAPKKYIRVDGVMKMNPAYKAWKDAQSGGPVVPSAPTEAQPVVSPNALPVVSNMDDHMQMNQDLGVDIPLAESTDATIEMMQEPEISLEAGMQPDEMVDELGRILGKYEVPMGLMNKLLMLSEMEVLEFMIDDSGSMTLKSDTVDEAGQPQSRWKEAHSRLKEMMEILAYVPFSAIHICFLNRKDFIQLARNGRDPKTFLADAYREIDSAFAKSPSGTTPFLERLQESFSRGAGKSVARWFFGDGAPNGGSQAKNEIVRILKMRTDPESNPMTFVSCTNDDAQVEWMKETEEVAPYCSECDDFKDESAEVMMDQGEAFPFSRGFYLVSCIVGAMNPDDLDAMDESVPFTKATLDNLLGIEHNEETYRHYFKCFTAAQKKKPIGVDDHGKPKKSDQLKKDANWESVYQDFTQAPLAKMIPAVQQFKQQLASSMF